MVILSRIFWSKAVTSEAMKFRRSRNFIDSLRLYVRGGAGGMGYPKFGGVGGNGGNVILEAKEGTTLKEVKQKYAERTVKASKGSDSNQRCILGKCGKNHVVYVPVGLNVVDSQYRLIEKSVVRRAGGRK